MTHLDLARVEERETLSALIEKNDEDAIEWLARAMCGNKPRAWQDKLIVHSPFAPLEGQPPHPLLPRWTRYAGLARNLLDALKAHAAKETP